MPTSPTTINEWDPLYLWGPLSVQVDLAESGKYPVQSGLCREGISIGE